MSSQEVFTARKEGRLDDAYLMALNLMSQSVVGAWDIKALAWCLIDLIKRDIAANNQENLHNYRQQLEKLDINSDEVLTKQVKYVNSLLNPTGRLQLEAKALSQAGNHFQAVQIYREICTADNLDIQLQISFGWELYSH